MLIMKISNLHNHASSALLMIVFLASLSGTACTRQPTYASPTIIGANAVIDTSSLKPATPLFFTYHYKGKPISFFVLQMDAGVQSYLDA